MAKRMTAEEVADKLAALAQSQLCSADERTAFLFAKKMVDETLVPQWQDVPDGDGWHWCEALEADAPPQKLMDTRNGFWVRWTVAGWIPLVGRVGPIGARPQ